VCLVSAVSSNFGFGFCAFFCLTLVPALYEILDISPPVKYLLKKIKINGVPRGPIMTRHVAH